jgi:hypothetical protein
MQSFLLGETVLLGGFLMHRFILGMSVALIALVLAATSPTGPAEAAPLARGTTDKRIHIAISGPGAASDLTECYYEVVSVQGGTPPYTLTWTSYRMTGSASADGHRWYGSVDGGNPYNTPRYLAVTATDALNQTATEYHYVYWDIYSLCIY